MRFSITLAVLPLLVSCASDSLQQQSVSRADPGSLLDDHGGIRGCNWYCGAPPITVTASNTLRDDAGSLEPANLHDMQKSTVWAEGASGQGIGTKITFTFDCTGERFRNGKGKSPVLGINGFSIVNGFAKTPELWTANGRVKSFKVYFNGAFKGRLAVKDSASPQTLKLPNLTLPTGRKSQLVLEIAEVYPGSTYEDTCIADIKFDGYGVGH